jgi:ABC-type Fe3+/spermidine/putrescine transport system ATPase subunit
VAGEVRPLISLRAVSKRSGGALAVDALSLDIRQGELVSLVDGSGCGKTTTLRMIAGFERPDAGEIAFDGRASGRPTASW